MIGANYSNNREFCQLSEGYNSIQKDYKRYDSYTHNIEKYSVYLSMIFFYKNLKANTSKIFN